MTLWYSNRCVSDPFPNLALASVQLMRWCRVWGALLVFVVLAFRQQQVTDTKTGDAERGFYHAAAPMKLVHNRKNELPTRILYTMHVYP